MAVETDKGLPQLAMSRYQPDGWLLSVTNVMQMINTVAVLGGVGQGMAMNMLLQLMQ